LAAALKRQPDVEVELVNGNRGELTVLVDGHDVASKKGDTFPSVEEVVAAVRGAAPAGAR
jgi:hypothetical protein